MARAAQVKSETIKPVRLTSPYGFIDEYGDRWHWDANQIVRNPAIIALLLERGAPVETVT